MPRRRTSKTRASSRSAATKADREFVSEAEEILERMREDLTDLSDQRSGGPAGGGDVDPELVNGLFRSAHSLKALAGMFGLDPIQHLAHRLEEILDSLRLGRVGFGSETLGVIGESVRHFAALLERVGDDAALAELAQTSGQLAERIAAAASAPEPANAGFAELDLDPGLLRALTEYEEHRLRENLERGRQVVLVEASFEIISFEEGLSELTAAIREVGEVLSTLPAPGEAPESQIRFSLLSASDHTVEDLSARLERRGATVRSARRGQVAPAPVSENVSPGKPQPPPFADESSEQPTIESLKSISGSVRVDIRKLDELMNLVGELVIQRGAIRDLLRKLQAEPHTAHIGNEFAKVYKDLDRKLKGLQGAVIEVRLVPLRQVFEKVSRVVRTLRRELGKKVGLEIRGSETELDKLIIEELVDPLMHIVRNAIDHAIEPPEERLAAGKPEEGRIRLDAFQRGTHVVIAVSDDGVGIDLVALRARAEEAGLVRPDENLTEKETVDLIFSPGLSTSAEVTETSGRGVGMDVVRSNLTALGGVVEVDSTPGRGTTMSLTVPITLAIVQSLIVRASGQAFAVPLNAVLETLLVEPREIQRSEGREMLNLRGDPLLLRRLATEFELSPTSEDEKMFAVVVGIGGGRIGLLVDSLEGQQDTVIKPIQGPIQSVRGIAGATELGGAEPVLVLDVSALVEDGLRRREAA